MPEYLLLGRSCEPENARLLLTHVSLAVPPRLGYPSPVDLAIEVWNVFKQFWRKAEGFGRENFCTQADWVGGSRRLDDRLLFNLMNWLSG